MITYIFQHTEVDNRIKMIDADNSTQALEKLAERLKRGYKDENCNLQYDDMSDYEYFGKI